MLCEARPRLGNEGKAAKPPAGGFAVCGRPLHLAQTLQNVIAVTDWPLPMLRSSQQLRMVVVASHHLSRGSEILHFPKLASSGLLLPPFAPVSRDRMKNPDALMVVYYVVLSGVLVFALGYFAGWHRARKRAIMTVSVIDRNQCNCSGRSVPSSTEWRTPEWQKSKLPQARYQLRASS